MLKSNCGITEKREKYEKFQGNGALVLLGCCQSFHKMYVTNCCCSTIFLVSTFSNKCRNLKADFKLQIPHNFQQSDCKTNVGFFKVFF